MTWRIMKIIFTERGFYCTGFSVQTGREETMEKGFEEIVEEENDKEDSENDRKKKRPNAGDQASRMKTMM